MRQRFATVAYTLVAAGLVAAIAYGFNTSTIKAKPSLGTFEFHREAAPSPEVAAETLFRGVATESPTHFVQHLLLGVCDGHIDTLQKFAECLHETEFSHGADSFSFYDLRNHRKGINPKKPMRVVALKHFDTNDKQVAALESQMISTYYAQTFACVDVAGEGYDGLEYQTRIVVAQIDGSWYAMPRCRSAQSFYDIADMMRIAPPESRDANNRL